MHRYLVALDFNVVDDLATKRLQAVQRTALVKGFRRGRAPLNVIRIHHGTRTTNAIVDRLALDVARTVISEHALRPVGRPTIEIVEDVESAGKQVIFTLVLEVFPTVVLKPINKLKIEKLTLAPSELGPSIESGNAGSPGQLQASDAGGLNDLLRQHLKRQVFDLLMAEYDFPVPSQMTEREHNRVKQTYKDTVDDFVSPELDLEFHSIAERRVRLAILLSELGREHKISISKQEVERLVQAQVAQDGEHGAAILNYYLEHPTALAELQSNIFEDQVVDSIVDHAIVECRSITAVELLDACRPE
jgi:FKBP-type peptidyl-prolyl cis-trans isomerase (trigger factor)